MIKLDISVAVFLYLTISCVGLFLLWISFESKSKFKISLEDRVIWQCNVCTHTYIDSRHDLISSCPQCGSYNERKKTNHKEGKNG